MSYGRGRKPAGLGRRKTPPNSEAASLYVLHMGRNCELTSFFIDAKPVICIYSREIRNELEGRRNPVAVPFLDDLQIRELYIHISLQLNYSIHG